VQVQGAGAFCSWKAVAIEAALGPNQILSFGCMDGRNIWLSNLAELHKLIEGLGKKLGPE
jgi:hypothetical protein